MMSTTPYRPTASGMNLVVMENESVQVYELDTRSRWTIGRKAEGNAPDIPLKSGIAGRKHGQFLSEAGNWYYCENRFGNTNTTLHNGKPVPTGKPGKVSPLPLKSGDVLRIDYPDPDAPDPRGVWMLVTAQCAWKDWAFFQLDGRLETLIGRDPKQCDIVFPMPYISTQHAVITIRDGRCHLRDLGSRTGTWLNGEQLGPQDDARILREKDWISLCDCHLIFTGRGVVYCKPYSGNPKPKGAAGRIDIASHTIPLFAGKPRTGGQTGTGSPALLKVDIRSKKVTLPASDAARAGSREKELLREIHLEIRPGELVALLGSAGAGKSTLMNCMNGMEREGVDGMILFRGEDLYRNFDRLKYVIGSVPQENIFHERLTVWDELISAAEIRLNISRKEIYQHVESTLKLLGMLEKKDVLISKLSGGEKKRINIGIDLVAYGDLLCLDEPDAGLDPKTKKDMITLLRNLAHEPVDGRERSVIAIIHDLAEIDQFDRMILLLKADDVGRLAYTGTPAGARKHFGVENLNEIYRLVQDTPEKYIWEG